MLKPTELLEIGDLNKHVWLFLLAFDSIM